MATIYITSENGKLKKNGDTLQLTAYDGTISTIFPFKTEQLVVTGSVEITGGALGLLMKHAIDTVFLGKNGRFHGKLVFQESKNVFLRQKQFKRLDDGSFRLAFARAVVGGKLRNQLAFMQRIGRRRDDTQSGTQAGGATRSVEDSIKAMKRTIDQLEEKNELDAIRGIEGLGARHFFSVFRHNIIQDWAVFNGRSMHPPLDNVNAVLSFLYTLLFYRIESAIEAAGLDGYVGYFHALDYGKKTLAFDLMEEFRTPLADTLCCALFNLGILQPADFEEVTFSERSEEYPMEPASEASPATTAIEEKRGVLCTREGLRKVIAHFEKKLDTPIYHEPLQAQYSYRRLIFEQVAQFKRVINGEERQYRPLQVK